MLKDKIVLISKDVLMSSYLPVYGNTYNKTPNIDQLAEKGTVFEKHYTVAPSTAMSFTGMFTGVYSYETDRKRYSEVSEWDGETLFDRFSALGYACNIIWDKSYIDLAQKYSKCYGKKTKIHNTDFLTRKQPVHINGKYDDMSFDAAAEQYCLEKTEELVCQICKSEKVFLWIHFPHALLGRNAYGSDIDTLDKMVGIFRKYFSDDAIYITADHGHMNGSHGKYGYGFDLYESAIRIPLITPRINGMSRVTFPTSNRQLSDIIFGEFCENDILYSETAYYMQPHRKMAVIHGNYKYIYEKSTQKEYLFDVEWDPDENINLAETEIYDTDRKKSFSSQQRFFYPHWQSVAGELEFLRNKKNLVWKNAGFFIELKEKVLLMLKRVYLKLRDK